MNDKIKIFLKKIFPLGFLVAVNNFSGSVLNKFRYFGFLKEWRNFKELTKKSGDNRFELSSKEFYPILHEKNNDQAFDRHYVYHLAWAARKVSEIKPDYHVDISSSLYFSTMISAFVPVRFYDYRPADLHLSGLTSERGDLMNLPFADNSVHSISCMHTVEHIGLGRYGDPLDPEGDLKAMVELKRVVAPGGNLLFVVPMGKARLRFNAERNYSFEQIIKAFQGMTLKQFSLLPDSGHLIDDAAPEMVKEQSHGCGCFWFIKP